jgi:hypothetical protein
MSPERWAGGGVEAAELRAYGCSDRLLNLLRHQAVQVLLAAEKVAVDLLTKAPTLYLIERLSRELVRATAKAMSGATGAGRSQRSAARTARRTAATIASILHALGTGWRPEAARLPALTGAYLDGAYWANVVLTGAQLLQAT